MRLLKNSGISWYGDIPSTWTIAKIKDIFSVISGSTPDSNNLSYWDGNINWITPADYKTGDKYVSKGRKCISQDGYDSCGTTMIPKGSVIFSKRAPIGSVAINTAPLCTNQGCLSCIPKNATSTLYYYFVMSVLTDAFELYGSGTTFKEISATDFSNFHIPFPPYNEQQRIADFLDCKCADIDNVIGKTKASIEEYKKLKLSVITEAVTKGICGERPMKDSGIEWIGEIPEEWKSIRLKYCTYIRARLGWKGLKADEYVESGYPLLSAFNIINSKLDFSEVNFINKFRYDESPEIKLALGDILLVKDGAGIGKCAIVDNLPYESTTNGSLAVITVEKNLEPKFLYYYFLSTMFQKLIDQLKDGMGVPHLFQSDMREIEVVFGSPKEQQEIASYLDKKCSEIDTLIASKEKFITELESYKKSLIYEYVTGKKEVPAEV